MSKLLVAYFSKSGITKAAAEKIARVGDGTLFEIVTEKKYPAGYAATVIVAKKEQLVHELPTIIPRVEDFASYDRIALGFPVWWFTCPQAILSFLSQYDFSGKKVLPFCTHGGSGPRKSAADIRAACAGDVRECFDANGATDDAVRRWLAAE